MRPFAGVQLTAVLAVAGALAACGRDPNREWSSGAGGARVCVDAEHRRVADDRCPPRAGVGPSPFLWYYLAAGRGRGVPAIGGAMTGGAFAPAAGRAYGAAPPGGIARGGFGGTASSFGGLGGEGVGE